MNTPARRNEGVCPATPSPASSSRAAARMVGTALVAAGIATATVSAAAVVAPVPAHAAVGDQVRTIARLDARIRELGSARDVAARAATGALDEASERLLLERELVRRAGAEGLQAFRDESAANAELVDWLLGDIHALRYYILGGTVHANTRDGSAAPSDYTKSLGILRDLRAAYAADLKSSDADVFLRMMIAASLDVSGRARLWTGDPGFVSDPLVRYKTIKVFRADPRYRFQKDLFDALPVESMRLVFENQITDEELPWLANYSLWRYPASDPKTEDSRLNAYSYVAYTGNFTANGGYSHADFYDEAKFSGPVTEMKPTDGEGKPPRTWPGGWREKYRLVYDDRNFPNASEADPFHIGCGEISKAPGATTDKTKYHRLWMAFEKGGVCGALAKTFANLNGMVGVPSFVVGQPGHAVALTYELRRGPSGEMEPTYRIQNDVSGWEGSNLADAAHWLIGWGRASRSNHIGSYVLLAQEALSDEEAYRRSYEARLVAASFEDAASREAALDEARSAQPVNLDAIRGQMDAMQKRGAEAEEWAAFAEGVARDLAYHPLPMHDLLKEIEARAGASAVVAVEAVRIDALQRASRATADDTVNNHACVRLARRLLGQSDGAVATFSFDGASAGRIRLGEHLQGGGVVWKYSLDGGKSWTQLVNGELEAVLSPEQVDSINPDDDIRVQLVGASVVNVIDITRREFGNVKMEANDRANRIYFFDGRVEPGLEMRVDGGAWGPFDPSRTYEGERTVEVRRPATGMQAASVPRTFTFTRGERDASFVPYEEMAVNSYSSSRDGAAMANRVIDGYYGPGNEYWVTSKEPSNDAWIVIDLGRERAISSLTYWRPKSLMGANGIPRWDRMRVTVSAAPDTGKPAGEAVDAAQFVEVERYGNFGTGNTSVPWWTDDRLNCDLVFTNGPVRARYFKIHLTDIYLSAVLLDFYEVHEPGLEADGLFFETVEAGQADAASLPLELVNTGKVPVRIDDIALDSEFFELTEGNAVIGAGATDDSWSISPVRDIPVGVHRAAATVSYRAEGGQAGEARTLRVPLSLTVSPAGVEVSVSAERLSTDSVRLSAEVTGAEGLGGTIEYALCETPVAPGMAREGDGDQVQGNPLGRWTADPVFTSLAPGETYYAFARVTGLPGLDEVRTGEPLPVTLDVEAPGPDGGDGQGGNGGDNGNGGDGGDGQTGGGIGGDSGQTDGGGDGDSGQAGGGTSGGDQGDGDQGESGAQGETGPANEDGLAATGDTSLPVAAAAGACGIAGVLAGVRARLSSRRR